MEVIFNPKIHRVIVNYTESGEYENTIVLLSKEECELKVGDSFYLNSSPEFDGTFLAKALYFVYDIKEDDGSWLWAYQSL